MTYNELVEKYEELGLMDYHLFNIADYDAIFANHENIKGYKTLNEDDKVLFNHRLIQFVNGWGLNARLTFKPISVEKVCELYYLGSNDENDWECMGSDFWQLDPKDNTKIIFKKKGDYKKRMFKNYKTEQSWYIRFDCKIQGDKSWYHFTKGNGIY